jgi:hypothetical protein
MAKRTDLANLLPLGTCTARGRNGLCGRSFCPALMSVCAATGSPSLHVWAIVAAPRSPCFPHTSCFSSLRVQCRRCGLRRLRLIVCSSLPHVPSYFNPERVANAGHHGHAPTSGSDSSRWLIAHPRTPESVLRRYIFSLWRPIERRSIYHCLILCKPRAAFNHSRQNIAPFVWFTQSTTLYISICRSNRGTFVKFWTVTQIVLALLALA